MSEPLVSVGLPTYNNPKGLRKTLECLITQTYENLEIIVSNNASEDIAVEEVCMEFSDADSRIVYCEQTSNIGAHQNFRYVHSRATGKYYLVSQDDDWRSSTFIENAVAILEDDPDIAVAMSPARFITASEEVSPIYTLQGLSPYRTLGNGSMGIAAMGLWRTGDYGKYDAKFPLTVQGGDHATIAHLLLAGKKVGIVSSELYLKDFSKTALPRLFKTHPWHPLQTYFHFVKMAMLSEHIPSKNKVKIPVVAATNFFWMAGMYAANVIGEERLWKLR